MRSHAQASLAARTNAAAPKPYIRFSQGFGRGRQGYNGGEFPNVSAEDEDGHATLNGHLREAPNPACLMHIDAYNKLRYGLQMRGLQAFAAFCAAPCLLRR